jgi:hypothetical protein
MSTNHHNPPPVNVPSFANTFGDTDPLHNGQNTSYIIDESQNSSTVEQPIVINCNIITTPQQTKGLCYLTLFPENSWMTVASILGLFPSRKKIVDLIHSGGYPHEFVLNDMTLVKDPAVGSCWHLTYARGKEVTFQHLLKISKHEKIGGIVEMSDADILKRIFSNTGENKMCQAAFKALSELKGKTPRDTYIANVISKTKSLSQFLMVTQSDTTTRYPRFPSNGVASKYNMEILGRITNSHNLPLQYKLRFMIGLLISQRNDKDIDARYSQVKDKIKNSSKPTKTYSSVAKTKDSRTSGIISEEAAKEAKCKAIDIANAKSRQEDETFFNLNRFKRKKTITVKGEERRVVYLYLPTSRLSPSLKE